MTKKPKMSPEEQERQELLDRYKEKVMRRMEDEFIERMRIEEEAETNKESS